MSVSHPPPVAPLPQPAPVLPTSRCLLRPVRPGDAAERQALGVDPEIMQMFGVTPDFSEPMPMPRADAEEWCDFLSSRPDAISWVVEHEGRLVGSATLHSIRPDDRKAQLGIGLVDRAVWGLGLGTEVVREVVRFGFQDLRLHRTGLKVFAHNERAIRCYLRCGFVEEGREREAAYVGGAWRDDVIMGILVTDPLRTTG